MEPFESQSLLGSLFDEKDPSSIRRCAQVARERAKAIISKGELIRLTHRAGCSNNSALATAEGAKRSAEVLLSAFSDGKSHFTDTHPHERFFGENISEAVRIFKEYFHKR